MKPATAYRVDGGGRAVVLACVALLLSSTARADREQDTLNAQLGLQEGPLTADLDKARIDLPAKFLFAGPQGARTWEQQSGNKPSGLEVGLVGLPSGGVALFEYAPVGFVVDAEKNDLVPLAGEKPVYDEVAHSLSWGTHRAMLGRHGVVAVTLAGGSSDDLATLLKGFAFKPGESYGGHVAADPVAAQGLRAIVEASGVKLAQKKRPFDLRWIGGGAALLVLATGVAIRAIARRRRNR